MAVTGSTPTVSISGADYQSRVNEEVSALWGRACIYLTGVSGVNDITATFTPAISLIAGTSFYLKAASGNTGAVTLRLNSGSVIAVRDVNGDALTAGAIVSGGVYHLVYDGSVFVATGIVNLNSRFLSYETITLTATWTKPVSAPDDALVRVQIWAGGAGGGATTSSGGGGGGAYNEASFRAGDLPASLTVTIGAGGAIGAVGGNSSFGNLV